MLLTVKSDNRPLTDEELSLFVERIGIDLPLSYLSFMRRHNGGRPMPDIFPIEGLPQNPDGAIQVFFGIGDTVPAVDLENILQGIPKSVPMEIFPIACTDGDDYICFDLRKQGSPIVYWDRREFWGNEVWKERYLFPIASNFDDLLRVLHDDS